jgi:hypothetical protein
MHTRTLFKLLQPLSVCAAAQTVYARPRPARAKIDKQPFGQPADAVAVDLYTLTKRQGAQAKITNSRRGRTLR